MVPSLLTLPDGISKDEAIRGSYGYIPSPGVCIMFVALFAVTTLMQLVYSLYARQWLLLPTMVLAGAGETLGWSGRLWSSQNIFAETPFIMQIAVLVLSPTPLLAVYFIIFGRLVQNLRPQFSRLKPALYFRIFLSCDIVSLTVQAIGDGTASSSATNEDIQRGIYIMLVGIIMQVVIILGFSAIAFEFLYRLNLGRPLRQGSTFGVMDRRRKIGIYAVFFATSWLFIRAVFRTVELADGWYGTVIHTQWLFDTFDAAMVVLALYTWNLFPAG
ncbi:hypothetical protein GYMLUDRAFT_173265 [Collybiopsis luxurians FD-317 M1]|uniref:RTA1-domain-containing protein n=1 Tax=Collybiopsis luxurians FD-317 M1 TaxID=944289 RepID=A0A0D0B285_9AGAR|nr:hypothetical protein GYMLUDRAFT_173265 [Collybiopsis luxurians FD-317 M1]